MERPNRPSALAAPTAQPPQPRVDVEDDRVRAVLPSGDAVDVLLCGATVLSWRVGSASEERLWLSDAAVLDGTKAVRGGVPVVFPVFATSAPTTATGRLPQHGLARTSRWEFLGKSTAEATSARAAAPSTSSSTATPTKRILAEGVQLDFGLSAASADPALRALWPYDFGLQYSVTLEPGRLTTSLVVTNEGDRPFDFQVLLHTYLRVQDITQVAVHGLDGAPYVDKVDGLRTKTQTGDVTITGETDRIYSPPAGAAAPIEVLQGGAPLYSVARDNLGDVVVWNPWTDKAVSIGDFAPKTGFHHMLCIEPGAVSGWQTLEPGDAFEGAQSITAH